MKDFTDDELITLKDAEKLGYSPEWLVQLVREGKLPDSGWVSRKELERLVRESLRAIASEQRR